MQAWALPVIEFAFPLAAGGIHEHAVAMHLVVFPARSKKRISDRQSLDAFITTES
jgi:hypothetical protein